MCLVKIWKKVQILIDFQSYIFCQIHHRQYTKFTHFQKNELASGNFALLLAQNMQQYFICLLLIFHNLCFNKPHRFYLLNEVSCICTQGRWRASKKKKIIYFAYSQIQFTFILVGY